MANRAATAAWLKLLAVLFVLALLYLVLHGIGFGRIVQALREAEPGAIWAAAMLNLAAFLLQAFRWQLLMPRQDRRSILVVFPIYIAGVFANLLTPGARVGGEPVRAWYMSRAFGGEKTRYLGTILADKFGNAVVFFVFLFLSLIFVMMFVPLAALVKAALFCVLLLVPTAVVSGFLLRGKFGLDSHTMERILSLIYQGRLMRSVRRRFPTYGHFEEYAIRKLNNVFDPIRRAAVSPKAVTKIVLLTCASWAVLYLAHYMLFQGLGAPISFLKVFIIVNISVFCGDVSVSPGGAGFMETAMIALCAAFGTDREKAAAVTLVSRGLFYLYGLGLGGVCMAVLSCIYGRRREEAYSGDSP
jgi:uncharacterized protein (TIRG00374 family)